MRDFGLMLLTTITGLFFFTTGYRKIFNDEVHAKFTKFLASLGMNPTRIYMVMWGEMLGGMALTFGVGVRTAAIGLLIIMVGAYVMDTLPTIKREKKLDSASAWISHCLCTPEAQLIVILVTIAIAGGGNGYVLTAF